MSRTGMVLLVWTAAAATTFAAAESRARAALLAQGVEPTSIELRRSVDARYAGRWELPLLGTVAAPTAVLIRPDGYVAWVGEGTDQGLRDALTTWFGPPTPG